MNILTQRAQAKALRTMGIKARIYNQIGAFFHKSRKERNKIKAEDFPADEKEMVFDAIFADANKAHAELCHLKNKRKLRAKVEAEREKKKSQPGYVPKRKTTKEEYLQMKERVGAP